MNPQPNRDERFDQVESTLEQLSNSFRHLLTAQVLMNDQLSRGEKLIGQLVEQALQTSQRLDRLVQNVGTLAETAGTLAATVGALAETVGALAEKVDALVDSQKHTDSKLDALTDIVRQWIERNGNGSGGQHPS